MEKKIKILLVEDDEGHIQLIKRSFRVFSTEFALRITRNLQAAKEELEHEPPDLILADLNLPDGQCTELLELNRDDSGCPMIVMTSRGDEELAVKVMKSGALDYVVKSKEALDHMPRAVNRALREWHHIQKHKQAIEALKQNEEKYRTIVEQASDVIFTLNTSGQILDINSSGTRLLLYSYNQILQFSLRDILLLDEKKEVELDFDKMAPGENVLQEYYLKCQDDSTIPFEISFRKLLNGKIIGIARNITVRKIQELEGRRNREELERFNRLAVGREIRMIGLKKEVNHLLLLLGQNEKYKIHGPEEIIMLD